MIEIVSKNGIINGEGLLLILDKNGKVKSLTPTGVTWGTIIGNLSDQLDLQLILNNKQEVLISGTNIKTVNGQSLLGSGNIVINSSSNGYNPQGW